MDSCSVFVHIRDALGELIVNRFSRSCVQNQRAVGSVVGYFPNTLRATDGRDLTSYLNSQKRGCAYQTNEYFLHNVDPADVGRSLVANDDSPKNISALLGNLTVSKWKTANLYGPWFVRNPELFGAVPTGRMAPLTASNFIFIALALLALSGTQRARFGGPFGALATFIGAIVLVGYWFGTPLLYGGHIIPVALSTACGFLCRASGSRQRRLGRLAIANISWRFDRAMLLRAFVPLITAAALINGWINTTLPSWIHVNPAVTSALCAVIFAALIAIIISQISNLVGGRIDRAEAARNLAQAELLALNAHLETKVEERTHKLRANNQQTEEELQMARELQIALLPHNFPLLLRMLRLTKARCVFSVCITRLATSVAIFSMRDPSASLGMTLYQVVPVTRDSSTSLAMTG